MLRVAILLAIMIAALCGSTSASADMRITNDVGGDVSAYVQKFREVRDSGQRVIIDGPCLSACTLLTGIVPPSRVCVTQNADLGFHAASYKDDATNSLVPSRKGSDLVMRLYPSVIKTWVGRHGGLTTTIIHLKGRELQSIYHACN